MSAATEYERGDRIKKKYEKVRSATSPAAENANKMVCSGVRCGILEKYWQSHAKKGIAKTSPMWSIIFKKGATIL